MNERRRTAKRDPALAEIARDVLGIETLETRTSDEADARRDWLSDNLTPQAVATIVSFLQPVRTDDQDVDEEVRWFAGPLVGALGGYEAQSRLAEEAGL